MASRSSRFTAAQNKDLEIRALDVLVNSPTALTIEQIQNEDIGLRGYSSQKMARVLSNLAEMGFVFKAKSKTSKRMVYVSAQTMAEQGYDLNDIVC